MRQMFVGLAQVDKEYPLCGRWEHREPGTASPIPFEFLSGDSRCTKRVRVSAAICPMNS
ncbi:hypothetical protein LI99_32995 [Mycolicibacterium smegmatis]|uniref:Uncharacterized protein n=2 Tax=Mycolicibacterium smegmatis (strain ATCC 700084 / mc(2)155) TaxID=246196 RepID=I7GG18_MYCS2|nr:hypothetical protein MSMEG_6675 [Mycolicibacterium smegmatis MC2 155]AIU18269.1 hypothetical protein LI99_32995 [Mycolicibacterium smegmatis]AFP42921.1 hypothetical protein MSMEI_6495 [Mycolicibacterium smegmatis MC2 155]AIU11644.1 hypothetical protein LJ00_32990 [Mycolicibacterium smegmatis MC2 155]AIU24891.1 hypothetical protein LI98_33000 [Mycolicibacterium smegmatis]